jgi:Na+/H+-dicarboxylate symporter
MLQFIFAGAITGRNPFKALYNMLPAYFTALGTASSAATIPVTIRSMHKNDIDDHVSGFVAPLCATIHMSGSEMKITACAVALMIIQGMPFNTMLFIGFCAMLAIFMIAGPGVPGGAIMAGLGVLSSILGFDGETQALMIALYIAMDSFGTACNVTGDGAIAMVINKLYIKEDKKLKSLVNE